LSNSVLKFHTPFSSFCNKSTPLWSRKTSVKFNISSIHWNLKMMVRSKKTWDNLDLIWPIPPTKWKLRNLMKMKTKDAPSLAI
jgi:hypothetical protein